MDTYPHEFGELQKKPNDELSKCCEGLFDILDTLADNKKGRAAVWPLQIMLLVLSPVSYHKQATGFFYNRFVMEDWLIYFLSSYLHSQGY